MSDHARLCLPEFFIPTASERRCSARRRSHGEDGPPSSPSSVRARGYCISVVGKEYVRTPHLADDGTLVELLATAAPARGVPGGRRRHRGARPASGGGAELLRGPIKLVVADHALPDLDTLARAIARATLRGARWPATAPATPRSCSPWRLAACRCWAGRPSRARLRGAGGVDRRAPGGWHSPWSPDRGSSRRVAIATSPTSTRRPRQPVAVRFPARRRSRRRRRQ